MFALVSMPFVLQAETISYSITGAVNDSSGPFYANDSFQISFDYDNSVTALVASPSPSAYQAVSNISGEFAGNFFSDPTGFAAVWNDSFSAGPFEGLDAFSIVNGPFSGTGLVSSFTVVFESKTYRMERIALRTVGEFVDDASLPEQLPFVVSGNNQDILLNFVNINDEADFFNVNAPFTSIQVIPIPAAVWLFGSGLGLLGWMRRRA